jgi:hypothetical protein
MIPETITIGHVLMLLGALAGLYAVTQLVAWSRHRGPSHGPGTPGYARARDARRYAIWSVAAAAALFALGCFSPLCGVGLT